MADYARAERLRELRAATHLSRERVASELGFSTKSLFSWEHGGKIKWENAKKIAAYYAIDPETLVAREDGDWSGEDEEELSQLDRIEEKLDELIARLPAAKTAPPPRAPRALGHRGTGTAPTPQRPPQPQKKPAAGETQGNGQSGRPARSQS